MLAHSRHTSHFFYHPTPGKNFFYRDRTLERDRRNTGIFEVQAAYSPGLCVISPENEI